MKKRICLALGALVIAMSIFSPMLVWAEPEGENPGGSTEPPAVEPTEPVTPTTPDTKPEKPNNNSNKNNNRNNSSSKNNSSSQNKNNQNNDSNNAQQQTPADTGVNEQFRVGIQRHLRFLQHCAPFSRSAGQTKAEKRKAGNREDGRSYAR